MTAVFALAREGYVRAVVTADQSPGPEWELLPTGLPSKPAGECLLFNPRTMTWEDPRSEDIRLAVAWARVRELRQHRLANTDWTMLPDVPMTVERRQQWQAYRQALRDITDQPDPFNIVWPTPPA